MRGAFSNKSLVIATTLISAAGIAEAFSALPRTDGAAHT